MSGKGANKCLSNVARVIWNVLEHEETKAGIKSRFLRVICFLQVV